MLWAPNLQVRSGGLLKLSIGDKHLALDAYALANEGMHEKNLVSCPCRHKMYAPS